VKEVVHDWLCTQPKKFFSFDGIEEIVVHCTKCFEKQGGYAEK
jgi:hypothetical protein